ncbi:alpha/beta fold hydrolase [Cryobacterium ruanii]|uniref:Alpha/beta hydrolase n=1 Tax=Cryobacterium ruanii TaxID=1259197 RepID=A0A4R9AV99_9MICO|nr:alpha/beta hydrolase [Cryobacterium ruanii]TFD69813.1 alpha/beta hydrolase [Cryobacterium ruanii]
MDIIQDHNGVPAKHGRALVNGVRLHYVVAGQGEPLFLLHGVPKTSYHWRRVIPLLTPYYTVIAPDLRGLGDSEHPKDGFDMKNMAEDIAQLATHLGYDTFNLVGEDWGASTAYQVAAQYPERVKKLVYQEMILPGFGLEDYSFLTRENVSTYVWLWHINFYSVPDFPEFLITGREREYFNYFIKHETHNPQAITPDALDEYVRCYSSPGGLRSMLEIYRATLDDADQNHESAKTKLKMPVLAVGSEYFIGEDNERQMREVAEDVRAVILPWGHQLAEEDPEALAAAYLDFFGRD